MLLESDEKILYETEVNTSALKAVLMKRRLTVLKIYSSSCFFFSSFLRASLTITKIDSYQDKKLFT